MKIYDISQEVFGCVVYPGDPAPKREVLGDMAKGDVCNLTAFSMCAHNGTHVDAPSHFIKDGQTLSDMPLDKVVGYAMVVSHEGDVTAEDARRMLAHTEHHYPHATKRLLIKGNATLTLQAAKVLAEAGIWLYGNESQTVGPENAPMEVHLVLLGAGMMLLEGVRLSCVPDGAYFLCAAPLCLGGAEGAPCRAVLVDMGE